MTLYVSGYSPNVWAANGPLLIRRAIKKYCQFTEDCQSFHIKLLPITDSNSLRPNLSEMWDINVFPTEYFYPLRWFSKEDQKLLLVSLDDSFRDRITSTYSLHFNNKLTKKAVIKLRSGEGSVFDYAAVRNRPVTYKYLFDHKLDFKFDLIIFKFI